jgi:hypothetical protein
MSSDLQSSRPLRLVASAPIHLPRFAGEDQDA